MVLLAACGTGQGAEGPDDDTGGMGVPRQFPAEEFPGERHPLQVRVHVASNGCFLGSLPDTGDSTRYLIVWPEATGQGSSGARLRLPAGATVGDRDLLEGDGTLMSTQALEGFGRDGYWDFSVGFCTPGAAHVLVLDSVTKS